MAFDATFNQQFFSYIMAGVSA